MYYPTDNMCDEPMVEGVRYEIDPTVLMLVRYAEQNGSFKTELNFRRSAAADNLSRAEKAEYSLRSEINKRERAEFFLNDMESALIKAEKKIAKLSPKKPAKKAKGKK